MSDQADNLRQLIHTAVPPALIAPASGPPMIVVTGGRAGVGTTTVAVNLAAALADRRERVLLIDATEQRSNMAEVIGVRSACDDSLTDVLAGKGALAGAITSGPAGIMLLTARSRVSPRRECESRRDSPTWSIADFSRQAQQRLLGELQSLSNQIDLLVVDVGSGLTAWTRRFWLRAQLVLLVSTTDGSALIEAYAAIKRSVADAIGPETRLLINQCDDDRVAIDAQRRFASACQRHLGRAVPALPALPRHALREDASERLFPRVWEAPNTPFGHAVLWLGRAASDVLEEKMRDSCATACGERSHVPSPYSTARRATVASC